MSCCAEPMLAALLALVAPASFEARVREAVAARWAVPAGDVALHWGDVTPGAPAEVPVALAGGGREGWFVVRVAPARGTARTWRLRAGVRRAVAVAARDLRAGSRLRTEDIVREERVAWGPPDAPAPGAVEPGWHVRRAVARGEPLRWPALVPPPAVTAGEAVRVIWERDGVRIARNGIAMNGAMRGGWVRVRVDGRAERMVGRAGSDGEVLLTGAER